MAGNAGWVGAAQGRDHAGRISENGSLWDMKVTDLTVTLEQKQRCRRVFENERVSVPTCQVQSHRLSAGQL